MKGSLKYCMLSQEALKMGKINSALRNIEKAVSLYGDPSYEYIRMILLLKKNDPETALAICEKLLPANIFPPAKQAALHLWRARALDLLGRRKDAVLGYREISRKTGQNPHLRKAAQFQLKRPFSADRLPGTFDYTQLGPYMFF